MSSWYLVLLTPFFSRVIPGIEQRAQKLGYAVLLGNTQGLREREITYAKMVDTSQADNIIHHAKNSGLRVPKDVSISEVTLAITFAEAFSAGSKRKLNDLINNLAILG